VQTEALILELAHEQGFDLAGIAPLRAPRDAQRFADWLAAGHHGAMKYLERNAERILNPERILPGGKSILIVGFAHHRAAVELRGGGRVARYAAGRDYHNVMGGMLRKLSARLRARGVIGRSRTIVDAGPLLERSHAAESCIAFESKAANLLHPRFGPWFFLAEILLEADLEPTQAPQPGSCGTCTACIDACPTHAIVEAGRVDARRCISYQTIENRGVIPAELRARIGGWAFGCDVCSEVCPWGKHSDDYAHRFGTHRAIAEAGLVEWLEDGEALVQRLGGSPLQRPRRAGLARNAAIALGNLPSESGRRALLRALSFDPAPLVREAAAWALSRAHRADEGVRPALEHAARAEGDAITRVALQRWASGSDDAEATARPPDVKAH
jgi:epoxyqueuosine reductase